jgi:hypothetical protein
MNELLYLIVGIRLTASSIGLHVAYFMNEAMHVEIQHVSMSIPFHWRAHFDLERGTVLSCGRHVEEVTPMRFPE